MKKERFYFSEDYKLRSTQLITLDDEIQNYGNVKFIKNLPRITVCGIYDDGTNEIYFGVARCSSQDTFIKKIGREIAHRRAIEHPIRTVKLNEKDNISDVFMKNAGELEAMVFNNPSLC